MKLYDGYLTEGKLEVMLGMLLPEGEWIHNKTVPGANRPYRPDYRSEKYKLVVEYNGHFHYTTPKQLLMTPPKLKTSTI